MAFDAGRITASLDLDRSPFIRSLAAARKSAADFARQTYQATLGADQGDVSAGVKQAEATARRFAGQAYDAVLGVDYASVRGDTAAAERIAQNFARQSYEAALGIRGTTGVLAELKTVDAAADRLDGRDVTLDVNADEGHIRSLGDSFKGLASNIRATGTVLAAASIPFGIAAIGAAIPTVAALAASVGGLAVALGQGLIGAAVAATGALGALGGAFALVAAPVSMLLGNLSDYDKSLDSVASAQSTAQTSAQDYADAQRRVGEAQKNVASVTRDAGRAVAEAERQVATARREGTSAIRDAERNLAEARRSGAEDIKDAERALGQARADAARSIADAERGLASARRSAAQGVDQAEGELEDARDQLASATRSLTAAQQELNRALRDEPLNQREATLDLADARDRASDAQRDYNKAVAENGRNSEEATDARRELQRANLDLAQTERDVRDARRNGSDELQSAREAAKQAYDEQRSAAEGVRDAERGVAAARGEGAQEIADAQRTLAQAQRDASGTVADAQRDVASARADAAREDADAMRGLSEARAEATRQLNEAKRGVTEARREGASQIADAQSQVADAQRAAAVAQKAAEDALKGLREETERLTPAQKRLYDEYQRFKRLGDRAFRPAQDAAARLGVSILGLAENYMPRLGRVSEATMNALSRAFSTFRSELNKPVEQAGITRYLSLIPRFTEEAATAAGRLGLALFNVFTRSLKYVIPLTRAFGDMSERFLSFTRSVQGQNAIDRFFANAVNMGLRLLPIVGDLAGGFANIVSALQRTGIVDQAVRGFAFLADAFERGTQAGGRFDDFLRGARELMPFVGRAAMDVFRAIGNITDAIIGVGDKSGKLTVLQSIFRGIGNAAKPLQRLVIGTFRDLGPEIAKLIPQLARFFSLFAGSSGPLVTFVRVIRRALEIFNSLPQGIKQTVVNLAALKLILGGLGVGAVVGPMGRFASNMLLARGAASKLAGKSALLGVAGSLASIGAVIAGGIGLGLLFYGLKRAYDKNEQFRDSVNRLKDAASKAFKRISTQASETLLPAIRRVADKAANALLDIFDIPTGPAKKAGKRAADATASAYAQALPNRVKAKAGDGSVGQEIGRFIGRGIGAALALFLKRSISNLIRGASSGPNKRSARVSGGDLGGALVGGLRDQFLKSFHPIKWVTDALRGSHPEVKKRGSAIGHSFATGALLALPFGLLYVRVHEMLDKVVAWARNDGRGRSKKVGANLNDAMLTGIPLLGLLNRIQNAFSNVIRWAKNRKPGQSVGKQIALNILAGLVGVHLSGPMGDKLGNAAKNAGDESRPDFLKSGKNAAQGFLEGFREGGIATGILNVGKNALKDFRKWQKEHSPARRWMPSGKNAALGFVKGFRDAKIGDHIARELRDGMVNLGDVPRDVWNKLLKRGWKGNPNDSAERLYAPMRRMARQLGPGDPGYLDDGFRKNSRQSAHRGASGYVQAEDGSWVYNPALYRKQQQASRTHRYLKNGGGSGFRWNGSEYVPTGGSRSGLAAQAMRSPRETLHTGAGRERLHTRGGAPHRGITKDEMREVHKESNRELVDGIGRHISRAIASGLTHEQIDQAMGGFFHHLNQAGADPR